MLRETEMKLRDLTDQQHRVKEEIGSKIQARSMNRHYIVDREFSAYKMNVQRHCNQT